MNKKYKVTMEALDGSITVQCFAYIRDITDFTDPFGSTELKLHICQPPEELDIHAIEYISSKSPNTKDT